MGKHSTYRFDKIPFTLDYKSLPTPRLLNVFKKVRATASRYWETGYCCPDKCFHVSEKGYEDYDTWEEEKWEKTTKFANELNLELRKRENLSKDK